MQVLTCTRAGNFATLSYIFERCVLQPFAGFIQLVVIMKN